MRRSLGAIAGIVVAAWMGSGRAAEPTATPAPFVDTYNSIADVILAADKGEWNIVHAILASTYSHAEGVMARAESKMKAGQDAKAETEMLAALVAQLGNEGDNAVAGVRKRLVQGGHHHNSEGEAKGIYDEGFVIITRAAKKVFLDSAGAIGRLGKASDLAALTAEWQKVQTQFKALHPPGTPK
ncbi:MAG TPA: hypothetical protein VJS92_02865 [Candidatus Polarisedimenticolaceae bacterium]|nr:hypothetical protein [Candidatus Polarisedimenticolaceae bacterium]